MAKSFLTLLTASTFVVLSVAAGFPRAASACSVQLTCSAPVRLFDEGQVIPGNLIYFKVLIPSPGALTLRRRGGEVVPASVRQIGRDKVFAPDDEVPAGVALELAYTTSCPSETALFQDGPKPSQQTFAFSTRAAEPASKPKAGTLRATSTVKGDDLGSQEWVSARAVYTYPTHPSVAHLIDHFASIDGGSTSVEHLDDGQGIVSVSSTCKEKTEDISSCPWVYPTHGFGEHTVSAWSTVVGGDDIPTSSVSLKTRRSDCEDGCALSSARGPLGGLVNFLLGCAGLLALRALSARTRGR